MAIHDVGFRGYEGARTSALARITAIAKSDVSRTFRSWKFMLFYLVSIAPALFALAMLYLKFIIIEGQGNTTGIRLPRSAGNAIDRLFTVEGFLDFGQGATTLLTILFSAVVGAGILSRDRKAGALELYFTRGIRPWQYVAGKWLGVWFLLLCQVLFPFIIVWLFGISVASEESGFVERTSKFMPYVALAQMFMCGTLAFWLVALSASTESSRFALLRWTGGLFLLQTVSSVLWRQFQQPNWLAVSPFRVVRRIAAEISGAAPYPSNFDFEPAMWVWVVLTVTSALWLRLHLRPIEVVA
ncbi:MAG: hypothetical protein CMJ85_03175 [Planctomycetes bacterium]|jgi:ABC-type transport system involved in multi-copper enzyme maturation permease subunit|nr:hypothetical protein [Planctomycetota bacterium]MDP6423369.1 ABC transporter permease subunit [Planctomycetota bacterium]